MSKPAEIADVVKEICLKLHVTHEGNLGAGAHKHAFLVAHQGRRLALKIAPISGSLEARFGREATALLECKHPAIATLHYVERCVVAEKNYWVMLEEYLPGGTLAQHMTSGPVDLLLVKHVARTLAGALEHLRDRGFVHRDIKPANILFRNLNQPVLTDFGIVRILGEPSLTQDFLMQGPGTPYYAAPEQLLNEKAAIDWRTDQFGLAVVIGEWILGRHPFLPAGGSPQEAIIAVASRSLLPEAARTELEGYGFGALTKALSPWSVQRYRRPADLLEAFK